tara:strand:- start:140 stop:580 length:441 start_codon:yes stop_codon:yes gene_type:complete
MPITWKKHGYSYANNASITHDPSAHAVTADTTNSGRSYTMPTDANIQSVEVYMTSLSGSPASLTMYLARDSSGDVAFTPGGTTGATQTIKAAMTTSNAGHCVFAVDSDFHFDENVSGAAAGTIYVVLELSGTSTSATADVRVNWRA